MSFSSTAEQEEFTGIVSNASSDSETGLKSFVSDRNDALLRSPCCNRIQQRISGSGFTRLLLATIATIFAVHFCTSFSHGIGSAHMFGSKQSNLQNITKTDAEFNKPTSSSSGANRGELLTILGSHGNETSYVLSQKVRTQVSNYREGKALILNVHITHHAGTTVCDILGHSPDAHPPDTPAFDCMGPKEYPLNKLSTKEIEELPSSNPWRRNQTERNILAWHKFFHFISWEFKLPKSVPLDETEWENEHLVSLLAIREPISRLLADDGMVAEEWPAVYHMNASQSPNGWWDFARSTYTDNFALRVLAGKECCDGELTDRKHLETAKALVNRFSFIIDMSCLDESLEALASILNITLNIPKHAKPKKTHPSAQEHIGNDDVYDFLRRKNKLDVELFEWAKTKALVDCAALGH